MSNVWPVLPVSETVQVKSNYRAIGTDSGKHNDDMVILISINV